MTDQPTDWLQEQPTATLILAAYADREALLPKRTIRRAETAEVPVVPAGESEPAAEAETPANEEENADAWIPRVSAVEGVEPSALSQLHGGLIARGFLKYELFGRTIGMRYRLTPEGRRAAEMASAVVAQTVADATENSSVLVAGESPAADEAEWTAPVPFELTACEAVEPALAETDEPVGAEAAAA